ncbi:MAG: hypothetical protein RLZZ630_516 [Bacteroidota bacterium]
MKLSNEAKIGILLTVTLALFIWGLNYLKGRDLFTSRVKYFAVYDQVDGLVSSNPVFMNGFRIGIVNDISFSNDKSGRLVATLLIDKNVYISRNSVARIFSTDLIGTKAMRIDLGDSPEQLRSGDTLTSGVESSFAQQFGQEVGPIKDKTERLIVSIDSLASQMRKALNDENRSKLAGSLNHLESSLAGIDRMINSDQSKFNKMISNAASIVGNIHAHEDEISSILSNLNRLSDTLAAIRFKQTVESAGQAIDQLNLVLESINKGEGTLGQLTGNDTLYRRLESSANNLDSLLVDLKAHPKRYLHFSVFGRKEK